MIRIKRGDVGRYQDLDAQQARTQYGRLQGLLAKASPTTRTIFAEPVPVGDDGTVDWFAHVGGQPVPLAALSEVEASTVRKELHERLEEVVRLADGMETTSADDAAFLRSMACYPSDEDVLVLNGGPVIVAWGHGLRGNRAVLPAAAGLPEAPHGAGAGTSGRNSGWRWLLLAALLALLLAIAAWWYYRDFKWPPWFDEAAFSQRAARDEDQLGLLVDGLEQDIEALVERCTPPPTDEVLRGDEQTLRARASQLAARLSAQTALYDENAMPHSGKLRSLQAQIDQMNPRISALLENCASIAELERRKAEEARKQAEQERAMAEQAAREVEKKRKQEASKPDEFDSRRASAGGKQGELTVTLLWNSTDDLDLHIICPTRAHIFYKHRSACGGTLDVDMNARNRWTGNADGRVSRTPVENVYWGRGSAPKGRFRITVDLFREAGAPGGVRRPFKVKVQKGDKVQYFDGVVASNDRQKSFFFDYP